MEQLQQQIIALQRQIQERDEQVAQLQLEAVGAAEAVLAAQAQARAHAQARVEAVAQAQANADQNEEVGRVQSILKTMQTPQIIRDLPSFSGEQVKLHAFIRSIDNLMPLIDSVQGTPMYSIWQQSIRAKIVGDADNILELYGTSLDWVEIKQNLITHYSDRRDEVSLTRDLFKLYQSGNVEDYYSKISHIVSLLINLLNLSEENAAVKTAKSALYQQMGLKVFLSGLRDPLGPIIRAQSPNTLKDALRLCLEENNYNLYKNTKQTVPTQPQRFQQAQPQSRIYNSVPQQRNNQPISQPGPSWRESQNSSNRNNYQNSQAQQQRPVVPLRNIPNPNPARPEPMDVDPSIRSRQVNYMNRPPQARPTNGPHYQIEYVNQNHETDQYNVQHDQSYSVEQERPSEPTFNVEPEQVQVQGNYNENQTAEPTADDLNFCMATDNNPKR